MPKVTPLITIQPSFSVVICNYNYVRFVGEAIESALTQDYPEHLVQVVVVDDGSTDGSREVYPRFAHDTRLLVIQQENRGQSAAFEAGVQAATGQYVCFLDSDDVFLPNKLTRVAKHIAELKEDADALFLCHDLVVKDTTVAPAAQPRPTWFQMVGIDRLPDRTTLDQPVPIFPFSIPCGLVFSRPLVAACLEALPTWAFPRGTDGMVCPAAFLKTGVVHYLREQLGVYRIHGANEFASLVNGIYTPRFEARARAPRKLRFFEQWIDMLDLPKAQRLDAIAYLRRFEHLSRRVSASLELEEPTIGVVPVALPNKVSHATDHANFQSHGRVTFLPQGNQATNELMAMAEGYNAAGGDFVIFLRGDDRLDREFVERHLTFSQHGAMVGVSCSDIRLASADGHLIHADAFKNSGAWKQELQQVPPLVTGLKDWVAPPMSACMFRRTAFLDRFFAGAHSLPEVLQHAGFWLAFQLTHHTSGVLRIRETLTTCQLPDGAAASYGYLSAPAASDGALLQAPVAEAAIWFSHFYDEERATFQRWLPPAWHHRFDLWLAAQLS